MHSLYVPVHIRALAAAGNYQGEICERRPAVMLITKVGERNGHKAVMDERRETAAMAAAPRGSSAALHCGLISLGRRRVRIRGGYNVD